MDEQDEDQEERRRRSPLSTRRLPRRGIVTLRDEAPTKRGQEPSRPMQQRWGEGAETSVLVS